MEIKLPTKCIDCQFCGDYTTYPYSRNPHYCCEMIWTLIHEDYRVYPDSIDDRCPLMDISLIKAAQNLAEKFDIKSLSFDESEG